MPQALKDAAGPGASVALFWPSAQEGARAAADKPWGGFFARLRASPGAHTLRLALQVRRNPAQQQHWETLLYTVLVQST